LFGVFKQYPQGVDVSDEKELKSESLTIFQGIPSDELKSPLITGSKDVNGLPQMQGTIIHQSHNT
jgi:hypothetical protein